MFINQEVREMANGRKADVMARGGGTLTKLMRRRKQYEAGSPAGGAKAMGAKPVKTNGGRRKPKRNSGRK